MLTQLLIGGWLRELFTLGVTADLYAGVPALYVNFVDYDVAAHDLGPRHPEALRALRGVDRSIARFARVLRRVPEHGYDLFVLSDHGQIRSVPFRAVAGGASVAEAIAGCFGPAAVAEVGAAPPAAAVPPTRPTGPGSDVDPPLPLWPFTGAWQRSLAATERPVRERRERNAVWVGDLCIVPAGPNVNVYLVHTTERVRAEEIEARYPGALARLSGHAAIGFVLARDARGPVCYYRGDVLRIPPPPGPTGCPVFDRPDRDIVVRGLQDLLAMPSSGDVILYGHYADAGCVNFLDERGSHAGPVRGGAVRVPGGASRCRVRLPRRDARPRSPPPLRPLPCERPGLGRSPGGVRVEGRRWLSEIPGRRGESSGRTRSASARSAGRPSSAASSPGTCASTRSAAGAASSATSIRRSWR